MPWPAVADMCRAALQLSARMPTRRLAADLVVCSRGGLWHLAVSLLSDTSATGLRRQRMRHQRPVGLRAVDGGLEPSHIHVSEEDATDIPICASR